MTDEHKDRILADCLEDYHRQRARGEIPDMAAFRDTLGDLFGEFKELVAAETAIDEALEPAGDETDLPLAWGKYTILREIGGGAAGKVYEAVHRELGRRVALKVLRTGIDTDEIQRKRFRREAQALAQVHHDHIVDIYEFGELDGRPFYSMSLVEGPTLAKLAKDGEVPGPREVCEGLAGVANALHLLHEHGIIHRDVKPSNIMIDRKTGRYMLADFGLARTAMSATVTRTGDALGTPLYMSPEQMLGNREAIEARTDVYGLGATLYQMLTGKPPFKTENLHALMRMVLTQRPEPPRTVAPELPAGCSRIAMKCLEKEARDRYSSAAELEADMLAFARGDRVSGKPLSLWQRGVRQVVNHPVYAAAAVLLVGFAVWFAVREPATTFSMVTVHEARVRLGESGPELRTPVQEHEVASGPGQYVIFVDPVDERYKTARFAVNLVPGHNPVTEPPFYEPVDARSAADGASEVFGLEGPAIKKPPRTRSSGEAFVVELWFPRGKVTPEQARHWHAEAGDYFPEGGGVLEFYVDGTKIGEVPCPEPEELSTKDTLPPELAAKLKPGVEVVWHFKDLKGKRQGVPGRFQVVDFDRTGAFDALEAKIAAKLEYWDSDDARDVVRRTLQAQILMKEELYTETCRVLWPLIEAERAGQLQLALYKNALETLLRSDKATKASYDEWKLWQDAVGAYDTAFTPDQWDAFWAARGEAPEGTGR